MKKNADKTGPGPPVVPYKLLCDEGQQILICSLTFQRKQKPKKQRVGFLIHFWHQQRKANQL